MNLLDEESGQIKLVLAGGAGNQKEYEEIKELAAHCRYPVRFAGCVPQVELAKLYTTEISLSCRLCMKDCRLQ